MSEITKEDLRELISEIHAKREEDMKEQNELNTFVKMLMRREERRQELWQSVKQFGLVACVLYLCKIILTHFFPKLFNM